MNDLENTTSQNNIKNKPWLNSDGKPKAIEELRVISKNWSPSTWEEYLLTLEKEQTEILLHDPSDIENFSEDFASFIFSGEAEFPHLQEALELAARTLSEREFEIFKKIFGENQSETEVARELNLSRASIRMHRKRGLKKMEKLFLTGQIQRTIRFYKKMRLPLSPFGRLFAPIYRDKYQPAESSLDVKKS